MRFYLAVALMLVLLGCGWFLQKKVSDHFGMRWYDNYVKADDVGARRATKYLWWVGSNEWSAFYLAHMAVSDSIELTGQQRTEVLAHALAVLDKAKFPTRADSDVYWLKASLNAMLGNISKAKEYVSKACAFNKLTNNDRDCLLMTYRGRNETDFYSRFSAVREYEVIQIAMAIGGFNKSELEFGEMMALVSFDKAKANQLRDSLMQEGQMTPKRASDYCHILRYREIDVGYHEKDSVDRTLCTGDRA